MHKKVLYYMDFKNEKGCMFFSYLVIMLRSACFINFVKFKERQMMDFRDDGPFICIGENGSGKSSVQEGIRRCLTEKFSTSMSSTFDPSQPSYFICDFGLCSPKKGHVICGIVALPKGSGRKRQDSYPGVSGCLSKLKINETGQKSSTGGATKSQLGFIDSSTKTDTLEQSHRSLRKRKSQEDSENTHEKRQKHNTVENISNEEEKGTSGGNNQVGMTESGDTEKIRSYYKFALEYSDDLQSKDMHVNLVELTKKSDGETDIQIKKMNAIKSGDLPSQFAKSVIRQTTKDTELECLLNVFGKLNACTDSIGKDDCETILKPLSENVVFTFSSRSIGPLQWSESERITIIERNNNYKEAEKRCEVIKNFLKNKDETKFDKQFEKKCFRQITQSDDYKFELDQDEQISFPNGKYELLKIPEGILEAKIFSILMSSKTYKTIVLEEPDKGMHPQFIERMLQIMMQYKSEKRVIISTHNKTFVTPWTVPDCFVFRHHDAGCHIVPGKSIVSAHSAKNANMKQMRLLTSDHVSDILFAKKVLFYEGDSEMLFLTELKHQILAGETKVKGVFQGDENAYDELKQTLIELTFINMNGKDKSTLYKEMCDKLKLKHIFLLDRDAVLDIRKKGKSKQERKSEIEAAKNRTRKEWCDIREDFLLNRRTFFWLDGDIESMLNEMTESDKNLLEGLNQQKVTLQKEKGKNGKEGKRPKLFLQDGIESTHIRESVKLVLEYCKPEHDLAEFLKFMQKINIMP